MQRQHRSAAQGQERAPALHCLIERADQVHGTIAMRRHAKRFHHLRVDGTHRQIRLPRGGLSRHRGPRRRKCRPLPAVACPND